MARVLIVDDEEAIRSMLAAAFSKAGCAVRTAASVPEAMAILAIESVDVALSDVVMHGMSGHDLVRWASLTIPQLSAS
jgi:DNA-binding NtrC family response regulator